MRSAYLTGTRVLTASLLIASLIIGSASVVAYDVVGMRDAMRSVFKSMRTLLELSGDSAQLAAPANQRIVLEAATELEDQAMLISGHVPRDEISFLASSLDRYARWIRKSYEWRLYSDTRQLIHATVDVCIACHTRLTSRHDSPLASDFLDETEIKQLPTRQRAKLQTATRRFDDALATYTTLVQQSANSKDFGQLARDYLVLALRVKNDPQRARDLLAALLARPELNDANRALVTARADSLQQLSRVPLPEADLYTAQLLIERGETAAGKSTQAALVNYIVASRLLYGYLEESERQNLPQGTLDDGAKAYYLLGLAQYRIDPDAWLPQSELYLEKSIRTAPASEHARKAFELLKEEMQHNYPAAKGGMPEDVRNHLQILHEMVSTKG